MDKLTLKPAARQFSLIWDKKRGLAQILPEKARTFGQSAGAEGE